MSKQSFTTEEWKRISAKLQRQLGPEYLAQRPGPSGRALTYIEGKTAINIANDIFGFNGWSTDIRDTTVDFVDISEDNRFSVGISVTVRITLTDGSYHEDMGYGSDQNAKFKGTAFEKARKQAVTDATKRTLRYFGNSLGNCLYDNPYLNGIGKMAKPTIKFTAKNLYRHDQFSTPKEETIPQQLPHQSSYKVKSEPIKSNPLQPKPAPVQSPKSNPNTIKKTQSLQDFTAQSSKPIGQQSVSVVKSIDQQSVLENTAKQQSLAQGIEGEALFEPIVPEDSFTYEGEEDFLVQMLANDEEEGFLDDDEMLAGIITPPIPTSSDSLAPGSQNAIRREAPLSDLDEHSNKRSCIKRV